MRIAYTFARPGRAQKQHAAAAQSTPERQDRARHTTTATWAGADTLGLCFCGPDSNPRRGWMDGWMAGLGLVVVRCGLTGWDGIAKPSAALAQVLSGRQGGNREGMEQKEKSGEGSLDLAIHPSCQVGWGSGSTYPGHPPSRPIAGDEVAREGQGGAAVVTLPSLPPLPSWKMIP
jgi:hypothetical protein